MVPRPDLLLICLLLVIQPTISASPCTVCPDGSAITVPDKVVDIPGVPSVDCATVEKLIPVMFQDDSSQECQLVHQLSTMCGCPQAKGCCRLCPDGSSVSKPAAPVDVFSEHFGGSVPSCEVVEAYLHSFSEVDWFCSYAQQEEVWETCGCPVGLESSGGGYTDSSPHYGSTNATQPPTIPQFDTSGFILGFFGADTTKQGTILYSLMRASAILSIIGALVVIQDNLRSPKKRQGLYNQLIVSMAFFDVIHAIAVALVDIPRPADDLLSTGHERGTMATCKIQGFAVQLGGLSSLFANVSLSTCKLVVVSLCRFPREKCAELTCRASRQ